MGARAGALSADLASAAPSEALGRARLAPPVAVASSKGACLTSVARVVATPWVGSEPSCRRPSRCVHELAFSLSVQSAAMPTKRKPRAGMPSACSPPSTAHAMAHALKHEAFRATCSFPLAQQRTIELPMMPVMKMARLPLNIARTSITAAQHFISEIAAAVMEVLPNKGGAQAAVKRA